MMRCIAGEEDARQEAGSWMAPVKISSSGTDTDRPALLLQVDPKFVRNQRYAQHGTEKAGK